MKRIGCMGIGRPERPNSSNNNNNNTKNRNQQQLEATTREGQRKYIMLPNPRCWSYLEEASSKETRAIGEIFCCLKMQLENEENMSSSFLSSAIL